MWTLLNWSGGAEGNGLLFTGVQLNQVPLMGPIYLPKHCSSHRHRGRGGRDGEIKRQSQRAGETGEKRWEGCCDVVMTKTDVDL